MAGIVSPTPLKTINIKTPKFLLPNKVSPFKPKNPPTRLEPQTANKIPGLIFPKRDNNLATKSKLPQF